MAACVLLVGNEDQRYLFFFRLSEVNVRQVVVGIASSCRNTSSQLPVARRTGLPKS